MRSSALLLLLAGCRVVFGLEPPTLSAPVVSGTYLQRYVTNAPDFGPMVGERTPPAGTIAFAVRLDDGSTPQVDYADGAFSFALNSEGQAYRLMVTDDFNRTDVSTAATTLKVTRRVAGRFDRRPIGASMIQFSYPPQAPATSPAWVASTGIYTWTPTPLYGPTVMFDWRMAQSVASAYTGMLDATKFDRVFAIEPEVIASGNGPITRYRSVSSASLTTAVGSTATLPAPAAVAPDLCVIVESNAADELARLQVVPTVYDVTSSEWIVYAAPDPTTLGIVGIIPLAIAVQSSISNTNTSFVLGNPFTRTTPVVGSTVVGLRDVALTGTTPLRVADYIRRFDTAEVGPANQCSVAAGLSRTDVMIAGAAQLEGISLDADGTTVVLDPTRDAKVSWSALAAGRGNTSVFVYELSNVNGASAISLRGAVVASGTSAYLDSAWFEAGHYYILTLSASTVYLDAESGDFDAIAWPQQYSVTWSRYFTVQI